MIPLFKVAMSASAPALVEQVLRSGYVGQGPKVDEFERALAARIGNANVATVNSATSGLHLALHMVTGGVTGDGGEVLTTPMTCTATNWPILGNGLRIRWVDVDPANLNIDLDDLARKISPRTRAIVLVHWAGYPVDLNRLRKVLDQAEQLYGNRPVVIEDCAHAWGATYQGVPLGNHGNVAVFSFQAIKHLTCGDGGLVVLPDEDLLLRARALRWYGIDRASNARFTFKNDITEFGFKFHMNDINASIGLANLGGVDEILRKHRSNAAYYDAELNDVPGLELPERAPDRESSCWIYTLKVDDRDGFMRKMDEAGVMVSQVHERNDIYTVVREYASALPGLDSVSERIVSIPVGWWVSEEDRAHIVATIKAGW
jgi:dTDP-4-amino-4,6-dideoxygalactose transaminase